MTPAERVHSAFDHRQPDRVPIYEQSVCCRVASEIMGRRMRTAGGRIRWEETSARWESETAWQEYVGHLIEDVGDLIRALNFDLVGMPWRHSARPSAKLDDFTFRYEDPETGLWSVFHYDEVTDVFDQVDSSIRSEGIAAIERAVAAAEREAEEAAPPTVAEMAELHALAHAAGGAVAGRPRRFRVGPPHTERLLRAERLLRTERLLRAGRWQGSRAGFALGTTHGGGERA